MAHVETVVYSVHQEDSLRDVEKRQTAWKFGVQGFRV